MKYKFGDVKDGMVFMGYRKDTKNPEYWITKERYEERKAYQKKWQHDKSSTKEGHAKVIIKNRRLTAKKDGVEFSISESKLLEAAPDICPVLGIPLSWGEHKGKITDNSPSLDKVKPHLGYVEGNVTWMSARANLIKSDATYAEVQAVANWMKNNNA